MKTIISERMLRVLFVLAFLISTIGFFHASVKAQGSYEPNTLTTWQDSSGRWWVENDYYRIELSNASSFVLKTGVGEREWRIFSNEGMGDQWIGVGASGNGGWEYPVWDWYDSVIESISKTAQTDNSAKFEIISSPPARYGIILRVKTTLTFSAITPAIKVETELLENSGPYSVRSFNYNFFIAAGGNTSSDYYTWAGGIPTPFLYWDWRSFYSNQFQPVASDYIYLSAYDVNARQGLALISRLSDTADRITDINYGRALIEGGIYAWDPHYSIHMDASRATSFYIYPFTTDETNPILPAEDWIRLLAGGYDPFVDSTPPTIEPIITGVQGANGWYVSDVVVSWDVRDPESGIASSVGCDNATLTADTSGDTLTCSATNGAGDSNSASVIVKIDKMAPLITWAGSINNGESFYFGSVPPEPTCTASDSLSGVDGSCVVSGYATTIGSHILTATAKDNAGNQATENRNYTILAWTLKGFYQPVDMNGVYNIVKGGSTVPLKFEIFAGSTELTDITFIKSLTFAQTSCDANAVTDDSQAIATGGTSLRYDTSSGQFVYNWKTPTTAGKCYRLAMTTIDGSKLVAYFKLK